MLNIISVREKTIIYVSNDTNYQLTQHMSAESGINILLFKSIETLFQYLGNHINNIDGILIDVDIIKKFPDKLNFFDIIHTISTMTDCFNNNIKIGVAVKINTEKSIVKEILGITEIVGLYPHGSDFSIEEKTTALNNILNGKTHIPNFVKKMLREKNNRRIDNNNKTLLTPRQHQILNLIVMRGSNNKAIGKILKISESTVKLHISAILKKFGCQNRTQLALFCKDKYAVD